jgi:hypothetical protein
VRRFGKMLEELDAGNIEGGDDRNFIGGLYLYISIYANIELLIKEVEYS